VNNPIIWVLADDQAGNVSQCLGVVEAIGLAYERKDISYGFLAKLPNFLLGASLHGILKHHHKDFKGPWPDLVIAAGRRTAPVARYIKKASGGKTKLVQIMDPGASGCSDFDLICVPAHDASRLKSNQVEMVGAPHRVNEAKLALAFESWQERFAHLEKPRIGLIVGGATKNKVFSVAMAQELGRSVNELAKEKGASLLITTSRRTGHTAEALFGEITVPAFRYQWGDEGENPYFGILASSDYLIVTGDSVSMCSEACGANKPVYVYAPDGMVSDKHKRLHESLYKGGYAQPFKGELNDKVGNRLNAVQDIASAIRKLLSL
jgi:uncharacterized protein